MKNTRELYPPLAIRKTIATRGARNRTISALAGFAAALVSVLILHSGCSKEAPAPKPEDARPVNPEAPVAAQEQARVAQAVAMRNGIAPPKPAIQLRGGEPATAEVLTAYNQELARKIFEQRDAPETLEELVRKWRMPRLPSPPAGKRIVYDPVNRIIKLDPP